MFRKASSVNQWLLKYRGRKHTGILIQSIFFKPIWEFPKWHHPYLLYVRERKQSLCVSTEDVRGCEWISFFWCVKFANPSWTSVVNSESSMQLNHTAPANLDCIWSLDKRKSLNVLLVIWHYDQTWWVRIITSLLAFLFFFFLNFFRSLYCFQSSLTYLWADVFCLL